MPKIVTTPEPLKPFRFHGVQFSIPPGASQANGDCPFCGREGKWYCSIDSTEWDCKRCGESGNATTFLEKLWGASSTQTRDYHGLAENRGLLYPDSLGAWGLARSIAGGDWVIPGYTPKGKLRQLYRYATDPVTGKRNLLATPGLSHCLFGVPLFDPLKPDVIICEGPWDAIALWETLRNIKPWEGGYVATGSEAASALAGVNILAVPGCNVFRGDWLPLLAGKNVVLLYDNDHPLTHPKTGQITPPAAFLGVKHIAGLLALSGEKPLLVSYLRWGTDGYDRDRPHGYDVRDCLVEGGASPEERGKQFAKLTGLVTEIPPDWVASAEARRKTGNELTPRFCSDWRALVTAWRRALRLRKELEDVLAVMMATALSTEQQGDQLFLQVIGDAGSGKTRFCDGMLVSPHCFALEHLTGFHSGWKGENGEDYSLISRINRKTLITPEGDVLMSNPKFTEIMSQQRRIFDGSSGASYKNRNHDLRYTGLRTPWIIAGTPALLNTDQSRLGDRFIRVCINQPAEDEIDAILTEVSLTAIRCVTTSANGSAESSMDERMAAAYSLTGGYVDYLRGNGVSFLEDVRADHREVGRRCAALAKFVAAMRSRPEDEKKSVREVAPSTEVPTRLTHQFVRLAWCLAVVLGKGEVDGEVLGCVSKVALDTSRGTSLDTTRVLYEAGSSEPRELAILAGETEDRQRSLLRFLGKIGVVETFSVSLGANVTLKPRWRLTPRIQQLYRGILTDMNIEREVNFNKRPT